MIPLTNHDFQWGRGEVVIIYPDQFLAGVALLLFGRMVCNHSILMEFQRPMTGASG